MVQYNIVYHITLYHIVIFMVKSRAGFVRIVAPLKHLYTTYLLPRHSQIFTSKKFHIWPFPDGKHFLMIEHRYWKWPVRNSEFSHSKWWIFPGRYVSHDMSLPWQIISIRWSPATSANFTLVSPSLMMRAFDLPSSKGFPPGPPGPAGPVKAKFVWAPLWRPWLWSETV